MVKHQTQLVPGDLSQTSDDPSLSDFETAHRALINVWIPSVFLQGRAANAYHVYQEEVLTPQSHPRVVTPPAVPCVPCHLLVPRQNFSRHKSIPE
ncbi:hypothetical protein INR49_003859 [Caranx melampygus]|nr:hypothetical protein INR49_003859 [Caranx melampygus]